MTKKPRLRIIHQFLDETQQQMRKSPLRFKIDDPLAGKCQTNAIVAEEFNGHTYDTRESSQYGPWGHTIAIIPHRGTNEGIVVDVTQVPAIIGFIRNLQEDRLVTESLLELFGVGGWARRK